MIEKYLGMPYDIRNESGVNCWGLYSLVMMNECGINKGNYVAGNAKEAAAVFAAKLATGEHGLTEVKTPKDYDLVLTESVSGAKKWHCGVYFKGSVLHAKGSSKSGQVWYDTLSDFVGGWKMGFWRDNS